MSIIASHRLSASNAIRRHESFHSFGHFHVSLSPQNGALITCVYIDFYRFAAAMLSLTLIVSPGNFSLYSLRSNAAQMLLALLVFLLVMFSPLLVVRHPSFQPFALRFHWRALRQNRQYFCGGKNPKLNGNLALPNSWNELVWGSPVSNFRVSSSISSMETVNCVVYITCPGWHSP